MTGVCFGRARSLVVAVLLLQLLASGVRAHGERTLELGAQRIQPGGTLEVHADLGSGQRFDVALIASGDGAHRLIAVLSAGQEGHVQAVVVIPADVVPGEYLIEVADGAVAVSAPLTVAGSPIGPDGPGGQAEQEEGLLVPLPSGFGRGTGPALVVAPSPVGVAGAGSIPASSSSGRDGFAGAASVALAAFGAVGLLGALRLLDRGRRPGSGRR